MSDQWEMCEVHGETIQIFNPWGFEGSTAKEFIERFSKNQTKSLCGWD